MRFILSILMCLVLFSCVDDTTAPQSNVCTLANPNVTMTLSPGQVPVNVQVPEVKFTGEGRMRFVGVTKRAGPLAAILMDNRNCLVEFPDVKNSRMCTDKEIVDSQGWPELPGDGRAWVRPTVATIWQTSATTALLFSQTGMAFPIDSELLTKLPKSPLGFPWVIYFTWDTGGSRSFEQMPYQVTVDRLIHLPTACCGIVEKN